MSLVNGVNTRTSLDFYQAPLDQALTVTTNTTVNGAAFTVPVPKAAAKVGFQVVTSGLVGAPSVTYTVQHSPDGVNWSALPNALASGAVTTATSTVVAAVTAGQIFPNVRVTAANSVASSTLVAQVTLFVWNV